MRALKRAPGSAFSGAGTLLSDEEQNGVGVGAPQLSVAGDGSAAVAWWEIDAAFESCPPPALQFAKMSVAGAGAGGFGAPAELAATSDPAPDDPAIAIAGAGHWVAGWRAATLSQANPCAQETRTVITKASSGEGATYTPMSYGSGSVRAAAQPTGNGFAGLVAWIDSSSDDLQAAHFGGPAAATTTTSTTSTSMATPSTTSTSGTTTTSTPPTVCGDATGDGNITASDALAALRGAVGSGTCSLCLCDVSGDGMLTATDALAILRAAVGLTQGALDGCPESC